MKVDTIIHAKWLMTCEENNTVLADHALIIQNKKIIDILPSKPAAEKYNATETHHYSTHVVMPGFINTHTHLAMNYLRGLADDMALMDWLNNYIWPAEKKWVNHDFVYDASLNAMAEMIRCGTTCFNDMYFFLEATADAALKAGIRGGIGITVIGFPTNWANNFDEYVSKGLNFYQQYKDKELLRTTFAPHAIYTAADHELIRVAELAEEYDLKINMHIHETEAEIKHSVEKFHARPIKRLQQMGLISPRLIAVHMAHINEEDSEIIKAGKPSIVHCPQSNMKLASGTCPVHHLKQLGLNVALGTDGAASNNDLDMLAEMQSASFLAKLSTHNPKVQTDLEALTMATLNGAKALGIDDVTGSLTKGKSADFIAINLDEIETSPIYHPESLVVYSASRHQVTDTWVAGKQLMKNRQLLTLDEEAIKAKAKEWSKKIKPS
jgi:5-methylthioadenosine/S-adenosylhomocysteine deaminase